MDVSSATPAPRRVGHTAALLAIVLSLVAGVAIAQSTEPISPIPLDQHLDPKKVELGELLFNDKRLSGDGSIACSSCHQLGMGGADGHQVSTGVGGNPMRVNTPTIFNSSLNFAEDWDGRAETLRQQANMVLHDQTTMATNFPALQDALAHDAKLSAQFLQIYPDGVNTTNLIDALTVFEQSLVTPNSRFDKYLRGDKSALTEDEVTGYTLFKNYGCISCHQGTNVGGNMFQVLGVVGKPGAYFEQRGHLTKADLGRFNVTGDPEDKFVFKVPSLRNVALTAPYLHDGTATTLEQAVDVMFKYQLGRRADPHDVALIIGFLRTLTGQYHGKPLSEAANPPQ